jgi:transposase-like protein
LDAARRAVVADTKRKRRQYSTEQKVAILSRHMVEKVPVSDLCNELDIQPSLFYYWQRQLFERGGRVERSGTGRAKQAREGPGCGEPPAGRETGEERQCHRRDCGGVRAVKKDLGDL